MAQHHREYRSAFGDTTYTKVFVGGLAWETPTERMREYFQQFGDILEAVIITDRTTGKSKGYGFVTFGDPESARLACRDPNPMIDGRRANCNIASFGRPRPSPPRSRIEGGGAGQEMGPPSSSLQYGGVPTTQTVNPFFYQSYGCTPGYGYHQQAAMYNPQIQYQQQQQQQVEYYNQLYANMMSNPYGYGYGYPLQVAAAGGGSTSRPSFYSPPTTRMNNYSLYHPPLQIQGPHTNPMPAATSSRSSPDSQVEQSTAAETEAR